MKQLILLFLALSSPLFSQRIFITGEKCKADFDVIYTRNEWQADLCVHMVSYEHQAGRSRTRNGCDNWFFVQNEWEADMSIRVVTSIHPGRRTLYVYRDYKKGYVPPIRDRDDRPNYDYDEDYYNGHIGHSNSKVIIHINPFLNFKIH